MAVSFIFLSMSKTSETSTSCYNISTINLSQELMSENNRILHYMENVFEKINSTHNCQVIIVSRRATKYFKTNMDLEQAKFTYSTISSFADKIKTVMTQAFKDEQIECIRLKGKKSGEIFVTFDNNLDVIVFEK